jgi:hypothetical protein
MGTVRNPDIVLRGTQEAQKRALQRMPQAEKDRTSDVAIGFVG